MNDPILDMDITKPCHPITYWKQGQDGLFRVEDSINYSLGCVETAQISEQQRFELFQLGITNPERYKFRK